MKMIKNVQTFIACEAEYEDADIVLFGAPFDGTTSFRPGTRFGPAAIRNESFGIETYSPYCDRDLTDLSVFDYGDLELPFGNTEKVLDMIQELTASIVADHKIPLMIGGEHLVTLAAVKAVFDKYPDLHILHFDAHTDLREVYLGEKLSHSSVMKRIWDFVGDGRIHQFGIRSGERYEFEFAKMHTDLHKFDFNGYEETIAALSGKPVYVSIDLDILDPSVFPGTGTPEAGGVTYKELQNAMLQFDKLNIVGADVNELSPHYDASGSSTAVACKVVRELLLQIKGE